MDKKYLNDEFDRFFEFPTEDKSQVSSVSCKLFAEHIAYPITEEAASAIRELSGISEQLQRELETERALSFRNQVAELEQQRDDLLAALEAYVMADDEMYGDTIGGEVRDDARAVLASIKESK